MVDQTSNTSRNFKQQPTTLETLYLQPNAWQLQQITISEVMAPQPCAQLLSAYEVARAARIAENRAFLASLGLGETKKALAAATGVASSSSRNAAKGGQSKKRAVVPRRQPSRASKRLKGEEAEYTPAELAQLPSAQRTMLAGFGGGDDDEEEEQVAALLRQPRRRAP